MHLPGQVSARPAAAVAQDLPPAPAQAGMSHCFGVSGISTGPDETAGNGTIRPVDGDAGQYMLPETREKEFVR